MQRMIAEGAIGELRLWRATWLSDEFADPATPYDWRFDAGHGRDDDRRPGCHLIDMALTMAGPVESTCAQATTFIRSRSGGTVTVDDAASALLRFESGALGTHARSRGPRCGGRATSPSRRTAAAAR